MHILDNSNKHRTNSIGRITLFASYRWKQPMQTCLSWIILTALLSLSACGNGGGTTATSAGTITQNSAPTASAISIAGTATVGSTLTGIYTYNDVDGDAEGLSTFRWLRNGVAITGAMASSYTLIAADSGQTIKFEVTPVAAAGVLTGSVVTSAGTTILSRLQVSELLLAQTHALPTAGRSWTLTDTAGQIRTTHFELIANRDALAIIDLGLVTPQNPLLDIWLNGSKVASVAMSLPAAIPATEAAGSAFRSNSYTATIPAQWMKVGVDFTVSASNYQTSKLLGPINIGNHPELLQYILPFYLYGASPGAGGAPTLAQTQMPDLATQQEFFAKWPVSQLNVQTHPAGLIQWLYMVISPRNGGAAYRVLSKNDQKDGFATMSAVLKVMGAMRSANGEGKTNNSYYAPLMMWDNTSTYSPPGGGLGGGHLGTGDHLFAGIFIHELGHDFGLPHQGTAYLAGKYPYIDGSLKGSAWGYDQLRQEFLAPFVPLTAQRFGNCLTNPAGRPTDAQGRCVKRDPMWGGNGDQATGYKFATFSDFSTAQIQTDINAFTYVDPASATGYSKWDSATKQRTPLTVTTSSKGLYGFDMELPSQTNTSVYGIVITFSNAPCIPSNPGSTCNAAGVDTSISQIYPPVSYTGNMRRVVDPTQAAQLAEIVPNTGLYPWFCMNGGCDYTVKVTYADTTTWHGLLQQGFRPWFKPTLVPDTAHQDPLNSASFKTWGINAPGGKAIAKIELLHTPQVWNGFPVAPTVLISR